MRLVLIPPLPLTFTTGLADGMRVGVTLRNCFGVLGVLETPAFRLYPVTPAPFFDRHNSTKVGDVSDCRARADEINVRSCRQNKADDDENDADASNDVSRSHAAILAFPPAVVEPQFRLGLIGSMTPKDWRATHSMRSISVLFMTSEKSKLPSTD